MDGYYRNMTMMTDSETTKERNLVVLCF